MAIFPKKFITYIIGLGPVIFLYFLSITETNTEFSNYFEIVSFNLQLIIVYYWTLKAPSMLGSGNIFFAGVVNDVIMGFPLGTSSLTYLVTAVVATYIRNVTVNTSLITDWLTFLIAIFFANLTYLILISNFTDIIVTYLDLFYNSFFTFLFYPIFWVLFSSYKMLLKGAS
jgi:cell shape-determining protein MreD